MLEAGLILIFYFFTSYDDSPKKQKKLMGTYQGFQDVTVMAALGFGFLTSSLRRHGWSSVAFGLFMLALGGQWAVLLDGFLNHFSRGKVIITLSSIQRATMSSMSVLISAGAVLGKVNLVQLMLMTLVEVTVFGTMRMASRQVLQTDDHVSMMYVHVFAACFGLTLAWYLSRPLLEGVEEKEKTATSPSLFAMLGSREGPVALVVHLIVGGGSGPQIQTSGPQEGAMALTGCLVTHVHNAVLAGGVAVGVSCHLISSPWLAMVLGLVAGLISTGGAKCLPLCFSSVLGIHDTCNVYSTFGLPGLLGGITYIVLVVLQISWTKNPMISYQVLLDFGALSLAVAMGLVSGLLTGILLDLNIWKAPHVAKYFDDQAFWEFPHLAVGF
ncbi:PREDICTED: blood group Rh(CE) polypeptide [Galeopterus variegatus]|uniref:Blood group Rh(CE) polypeptide n=1 Tax=Galeopterus variegatus TaxID=482537 RepID=A0ABM0QPV1_GALVR|nr:PREDICTED: blood group Rh(CE) polypeptide [Galeopterus variegatus]